MEIVQIWFTQIRITGENLKVNVIIVTNSQKTKMENVLGVKAQILRN